MKSHFAFYAIVSISFVESKLFDFSEIAVIHFQIPIDVNEILPH